MKRLLYISILLFFVPAIGKAQDLEAGIFLGASNYQGDLAPDVVLGESHPAIGFAIKQNLSPYFAMRYELNYGTISANDTNSKSLKPRNLNFQSTLVDLSAQVEFNFYRFGVGLRPKRFTPYVFTGVSLFYFNPTTQFNGETEKLRLYTTEGQTVLDGAPKEYSNWQIAIPVGVGFKFNLSEKWNLFVHASYRLTFTDYLDDVGGYYPDKKALIEKASLLSAQLTDRSGEKNGKYVGYTGRMRGNPDNYDRYLFAGVTITRIIPNRICFLF
jgi:opacity protein-like surface antigen